MIKTKPEIIKKKNIVSKREKWENNKTCGKRAYLNRKLYYQYDRDI